MKWKVLKRKIENWNMLDDLTKLIAQLRDLHHFGVVVLLPSFLWGRGAFSPIFLLGGAALALLQGGVFPTSFGVALLSSPFVEGCCFPLLLLSGVVLLSSPLLR